MNQDGDHHAPVAPRHAVDADDEAEVEREQGEAEVDQDLLGVLLAKFPMMQYLQALQSI